MPGVAPKTALANGHGRGAGPAPKDNKIKLKNHTRQEQPLKQVRDVEDEDIWIPTKRFEESQGPSITARRVRGLESSRFPNTNVQTPVGQVTINFDMSARGAHNPSGSFTSYTKDLNYKNVVQKAIHNQSSMKKNPTLNRISFHQASTVQIRL